MAQLDKTFPTMDCSACILTPKMVEVSRNANINIMAYSEVEKIDGYVGNFTVTVRQKAHYVDQGKCTGCGTCAQYCPVVAANEFDVGMAVRKAIYIPFPQAVPGKYTIDMTKCIKCGICAQNNVCECGAINYDDKDKLVTLEVGTIIVTTGYDVNQCKVLKPLGYGKFENVINALEMERLLSSTGPNLGKPIRPSDAKARILLAGSNVSGVGIRAKVVSPIVVESVVYTQSNKPVNIKRNTPKRMYMFSIWISELSEKVMKNFMMLRRENMELNLCEDQSREVAENPDTSITVRSKTPYWVASSNSIWIC